MGTRLYRRLLRPDGTLCFRAASRSDTLGHGSTCGIAAAVVRGRTADCGTGALSRPISGLADTALFSLFRHTARRARSVAPIHRTLPPVHAKDCDRNRSILLSFALCGCASHG